MRRRNGPRAVFLPGFRPHGRDAPPLLGDFGARISVHRLAGTQIVDGKPDRLRQFAARGIADGKFEGELRDGRRFDATGFARRAPASKP